MALTILNNIAALAAENQLNITNNSLNTTLEQLSSGSRINSGADDPAGLAIANGLEANISALTQSASNATDGVGELQVADGALSQVTTLLDRAVTLATESATGTVSNSQRTALDAEYESIKAEIDSIGSTTNFNGGQVFTNQTLNVFLSDGSTSGSSTIGVATNSLSSTGLGLGGTQAAGTLTQQQAAAATASTVTLNGGAFVGSTAANATLTGPANNFQGIQTATATLNGGAFTESTQNTSTITFTGGGPVAGDAYTIGGTTYTFVAAAGIGADNTPNDISVGANEGAAISNLEAAINGTGTAHTTEGAGTTAVTGVTASVNGDVLTVTANVNGTGGASTTVAKTGANSGSETATLANTSGTNGSTVTIGGTTYSFVSALSTTPPNGTTAVEVIGGGGTGATAAVEATALQNLEYAVNNSADGTRADGNGAGTNFSTGTVANTQAKAGSVTGGNTATFTAVTAGTGGNAVATSVGGGVGSFNGTTFAGGAAADTVTVGGSTYTFVANYSATANTVVVGANLAASLTHLEEAVNNGPAGTGSGTDYASGTAANTQATAGTPANGALTFTAEVDGAGATNGNASLTTGNSIATTSSIANGGGFAATTFENGSNGNTVTIGSTTYTYVNALSHTATQGEVLAGANETASLANLVAAVNHGAGSGTTYTEASANASATGAAGATTATFTASSTGTGGNTIAATLGADSAGVTVGSFTGTGGVATATFTGGANSINAGGPAAPGDTVTVGNKTYTFVAALTNTTANQVLVGANNGDSLQNLVAAINGVNANSGTQTGAGYQYSTATQVNSQVTAAYSTPSATPTVTLTAITGGTGGNSIATTTTGGDNTFAATDLTGGGTTTNDLLSSADAQAALTLINAAVATVASLRGNIGATVNRLQAASSIINNQTQNLTSAENDVTAADIPTTVANLSQYSILEQTGISALAQANQQDQLVLKLLQ